MEVKYRNIRNLFTIWLITSLVVSATANTENSIERGVKSSQIKSLPGKGVFASLNNFESPYQILQRARKKQESESKYEPEPEKEPEIKQEPAQEYIQKTEPVSDSDVIAISKLKTVRIQNKLLLPMSHMVIDRIDTIPVKPLEVREIPDDAPKEPAFFVIKAGDRDVAGLTYRSTKNMNLVKLIIHH